MPRRDRPVESIDQMPDSAFRSGSPRWILRLSDYEKETLMEALDHVLRVQEVLPPGRAEATLRAIRTRLT